MDIRNAFIQLGASLSEEDNAAHDLWTWLPSHQVAQKHHGDQAGNHQPKVKDVLIEAAMYIAKLKRTAEPTKEEVAEERAWFAQCPCGDAHEGPDAR